MDRSQIEKVSKALADQTRLRIFEAISAKGQMNCGEIVSMRGVTAATVSQPFKGSERSRIGGLPPRRPVCLQPGYSRGYRSLRARTHKNFQAQKIGGAQMT